ncbi:GNAT family protein [Brevundimonas sp.]|uniref:GNAT family N-acetyltransferase n=1 Tax=Brevundimonas sp. TaxID=1871086 RepID=UPI002B9751CA|nr:GNAT family protein [Brevundimonas sp.]HWQ87993.1 GNAT family protein [Brevundimonas sp.]
MKLVPAVLENRFVRLEPFEDRHREPLRLACDADPDLWSALYYNSLGGEEFDGGWDAMRAQQAKGWRIPFAIIHDGACVGLSTFIAPDAKNAAVEIGTTYYRPEARGGVVNPATKRLMLEHAFACGAGRVSFQVDAINARSRAAMRKLGAVEEGTLRNDKITWTGRVRSSVIFSILTEEWPAVRAGLDARLAVATA